MGNLEENFEIRNESIEKSLKDIGNTLRGALPPGWGFALLLFDTDTKPGEGSMFYASNARREDIIKAMREFIAKVGPQ